MIALKATGTGKGFNQLVLAGIPTFKRNRTNILLIVLKKKKTQHRKDLKSEIGISASQ